MDFMTAFIYVISATVSFVILYFIIKVAVRNGYIEAKRDLLAVEKRKAEQATAASTGPDYAPKQGDEIW